MRETPLWVYLLFGLIIFMGIKASKDNTVPLRKMFVGPVIFTFLTLETLVNNMRIDAFVLGSLFVFGGLGTLAGYWHIQRQTIQVDREHKLVRLPGTWSVMILGVTIFAAKYYFGYSLSLDPHLLHNTFNEVFFMLVCGGCTGIFIGKTISLVMKFKSQKSVNLKEE